MLLLLDLETTGKDPRKDAVLEVSATAVRDDLTVVREFNAVIAWDPAKHEHPIDPYVVGMHTRTGLWDECIRACAPCDPHDPDDYDHTPYLVDKMLREFIVQTGCGGGERAGARLTGNSIHFDRAFMRERLPLSFAQVHYRQVDITTLNEFARMFLPEVYEGRPKPGLAHRAAADALESLETLRYYKSVLRGGITEREFELLGYAIGAGATECVISDEDEKRLDKVVADLRIAS